MGTFITRTPPTRAASTAFGAHISGSTGRRWAAMRKVVRGGGVATSIEEVTYVSFMYNDCGADGCRCNLRRGSGGGCCDEVASCEKLVPSWARGVASRYDS